MKPKPPSRDLLKRGEVAARLGVLPRTLSSWVIRGEFPRPDVAVGMRTIRWKESTVQEWIDGGGETSRR